MIYYATKETMQRFKLKPPEEMTSEIAPLAQAVAKRERGNPLYEWGCKLFYFDRRKCLQVMHFESRLAVLLFDIKQAEIVYAADAVAQYVLDAYAGDRVMTAALKAYYASSPLVCFDRLTDRSVIGSMNRLQLEWGFERICSYIENGVLMSRRINREINERPVSRRLNGKEEWFIPLERFEALIRTRFSTRSQ